MEHINSFILLSLATAFAKSLAEVSTIWVQSFNTVQELSSIDKKNLGRDSNPGLLGEKRECYLSAMPPHLTQQFQKVEEGYRANGQGYSEICIN